MRETITSDRYMTALKRGYPAEKRIRSVLMGGHAYQGYFYTVDKRGYFRVKIKTQAEMEE